MPNFFLLKNGWLTSFIVGQNCTYKSVTEAKACVRRLASFHCSGYRVAIKAKKKRPLLFAARMKRRLANFYRLSKAQVSGRLGVILKQQGPQFYFEGLKSWDLLCRLNYQAYCTDCWQERLLTHRDLASHNFMIDKNNKTWLIDFETAEYDAQIGDLGQVITRILAMHKWSAELFKVLLKAYEAIMPLNAYQHEILLLLLRFPNEFFREALGLAERKPGYNPKKTMAYLEKLIAENHYRHSLIHSLS
jgi:CotS family spore coat protein